MSFSKRDVRCTEPVTSFTVRPMTDGHAHAHPAVTPPRPLPDYSGAGELLRALAAPLRIAIVVELDAGPRCVHELVDALDAPQPLVSQHLRVLRSAGVVTGERRGREVMYSLADQHVAHIVTDAVSHAKEGR
jgi:DNA-binding transcriptional ArsR family regulator